MPNEYGENALTHWLVGKPRRDIAGDIIKPLTRGAQGQRMLDLFHGNLSPHPSLAALVLAAWEFVLVPVDPAPIVADPEDVLFEHAVGQIACACRPRLDP